MRRPLRLLLPVAVASGVAASCIPSRDNPRDPQNRPRAALVVYVGTSGGANQGTRSESFTLDASDSSGDGDLRFDWDLDGQQGFEWLAADIDACPSMSAAPCYETCNGVERACLRTRLDIPTDALPGGVGAIERRVRVRVRANGTYEDAEAIAVVTNAAPRLDALEDLFVAEFTRPDVTIDACGAACDSLDPDGELEVLTFTWTDLRAEGVTDRSNTGSRLNFRAPAESKTLLFRIRVDDGLAGTERLVRVHVGTQVAVSMTNPPRLYRVSPDFANVASPVDAVYVGTGLDLVRPEGGIDFDRDGDLWVGLGVHDVGNPVCDGCLQAAVVQRRVKSDDNAQYEATEEWILPGALMPTSVAGLDAGEGCAALRTFTSEGFNFDVDGQLVRLHAGGTFDQVMFPYTGPEEPFFVAAVNRATDTDCWAVTRRMPGEIGTGEIYRFTSAGVLVPIESDFDDVYAASRTASGDLLVAGPTNGCVTSVVRASGTAVEEVACVPLLLDAVAEHPDSGIWAHDASSLQILHLRTNGDVVVTSAPEIELPNTAGNREPSGGYDFHAAEPRMIADPLGRDVWLVQRGAGRLVRVVEENGDLVLPQVVPASTLGIPNTVFSSLAFDDVTGRVFGTVVDEIGGTIAQLPVHLTPVTEILLSASAPTASIDPSSGDIWIANFAEGGTPLRRVRPSGRIALTMTSLGPAFDVDAQQDGGAWIAFGDQTASNLVRADRDGNILQTIPFTDPEHPVIRVAASEGETHICSVTRYGLGGPGAGRLMKITLPDGTVEAEPLEDWREARGVDASSDGCLFSFIFDAAHEGAVWWDGATLEQESVSGILSVAVDPVPNQPAWLTAGAQIYTAELDGSNAVTIEGAFGFANLLALQRRCDSQPCTAEHPLHIWIVNGGIVARLDSAGNQNLTFTLPEVGSLTAIDVVP